MIDDQAVLVPYRISRRGKSVCLINGKEQVKTWSLFDTAAGAEAHLRIRFQKIAANRAKSKKLLKERQPESDRILAEFDEAKARFGAER